MAPSAVAPRGPATVGHYELLLELAAGGMAVVYLGRAKDGRATAPLVAVKRPHRHLATDKNFLAMLLDEARLASAISHENVVKVRELQFHDGEPFIVMDYVEGASLSELRKELASQERAFDVKVALRIILDALAGLHAAHELCDADGKPLGIVHRDISPHNVLVGSDGRARLTDFGIAQAADRLQETRTHEVKGKLAYLAPERVDKRRICTRQSDVFSMGIVLWECLAGRRLFRGDQALDTLQEVMHAPIPRLRRIGLQIAPQLDDVIAKALSRDLEVRFATALEFKAALEEAAGRASIGRPEQVAQLVETLYAARMTERQEQVGGVLGDAGAAARLFSEAGFPRPAPGRSISHGSDVLRAIAPPAPSERYLFGDAPQDYQRIAAQKTRWMVVGGIAAGVIVGAAAAFLVATRGASHAQESAAPHSSSARAASPSQPEAAPPLPPSASAWRSAGPPPAPLTRHLRIELPFLASHLAIDAVGHDIYPAADFLALDVAVDAGTAHHVVAVALDGSQAEGDLREVDGVARPLGGGWALISHRSSASTGSAPAPHGPGVNRNGFTKLR